MGFSSTYFLKQGVHLSGINFKLFFDTIEQTLEKPLHLAHRNKKLDKQRAEQIQSNIQFVDQTYFLGTEETRISDFHKKYLTQLR